MLRVFSAFAGYGTDNFALKRLGIPFKCVGYSEIDRYAIQCFRNNHCFGEAWNEDMVIYDPANYGDIKDIDPTDIQDFDLFTGGFPCQAFSTAGKGLGELDTRGTLFNEIIRICEVKQPKWIFLENVKGLISKKHKATFDKILSELDRIGYTVYWKVLNTKHYGIPQNRERVFFVCIRKDLWDNFKWPDREDLEISIKDILEPEVDEKYYLSEAQVKRLLESSDLAKKFSYINPDVAGTMTARQYANWKGNFIQCDVSGKGYKSQQDRVWNPNGVIGAIPASRTENKIKILDPTGLPAKNVPEVGQGDRIYDSDGAIPSLNVAWQPKILQRGRGYNKGGVKELSPTISSNSFQQNNFVVEQFVVASRGRNPENPSDRTSGVETEQRLEARTDGCSNALTTVQKDNMICDLPCIRRLTPKECFRLQGFLNDEIKLEGISESQQYKLCGNGQSVNVVAKIFAKLFNKPYKYGVNRSHLTVFEKTMRDLAEAIDEMVLNNLR